MRPNNSSKGPSWSLAVTYTDKPVSGWGGLVAIARFFEGLHLREVLKQALPDERRSPNKIPVVDQVLVLFAAILTGAQRFAHVERLKADETVQSIFGIDRMPSSVSLTRYFGGFARAQVDLMVDVLWRFSLALVHWPPEGLVIDLDSTVITRFGTQQGSTKGYNPTRRGRRSHHPILAMVAGVKIVLNAWMRSGNSYTANGVCGFLDESLGRLPSTARASGVRADAGFCQDKFLAHLEEKGLKYAVVLKMDALAKSIIRTIQRWAPIDDDYAVAEFQHQPKTGCHKWRKARRVVVIRQVERDDDSSVGRTLFEIPGYTFRAFVTNSTEPPVEVWRFYDQRADCENRIKELKDDFGAAGFCLQSFDGTDAVFRLVCFLFNLVAHFKATVTRDTKPQLNRVRSQLLVVGAILGADGRNPVLRLGLHGRRREAFARVLAALDELFAPTATQLDFFEPIRGLARQTPWYRRGARPPVQVAAAAAN